MALNSIRIYRFIDPSRLTAEVALLQIYLGVPASGDPQAFKIAVNPYTGHFALADNTFITSGNDGPTAQVPQNETQARKAVSVVVMNAEKRRREQRVLAERKFPNLFQSTVYSSAQPLLDPVDGSVREWELRYQPQVRPSQDSQPVPVMNGSVVFRIGPSGRLVGLVYDWMPIGATEDTACMWPVLPPGERSSIVYMVEPGQNLCAPYLVGVTEKRVPAFESQMQPTDPA